MNWTCPLIRLLQADFGGFATFCHDPDGILEIPAAREALRAVELRLDEWDGSEAGLTKWAHVPAEHKPLIRVSDSASRFLLESHLPNHRWQSISVSDIFPAFAPQIIRELPVELWQKVCDLGTGQFRRLSQEETLDRLGRGIYGLDPYYLRYGQGWWMAWLEVAGHEYGWPLVIAQWAAHSAPTSLIDTERLIQTLTVPDAARTHLLAVQNEQPDILETLSPHIRVGLERLVPIATLAPTSLQNTGTSQQAPSSSSSYVPFDLIAELCPQQSAPDVLDFARHFAGFLPDGVPSDEIRGEADALFAVWLQQNYGLAMTASGPQALSLPKLVSQLDAETEDRPLLLALVDSLGLRAWQIVKKVWLEDGVIGRCKERAAFAVVPTITSFSRRAIFEGKLPVAFGPERHTQGQERKLWKKRFGTDGEYFAPVEHLGISDAFATRRRRVAVVDVQWDSKGHAIDPRFETIEEEATKWATRTDMRKIVGQALEAGYRVVVTSDHGHMTCRGMGRPHVGETVSDRSKRCLIFRSPELREQYTIPGTIAWTPSGLHAAMHPLFAAEFTSFDYTGARGVSHGGLSLEEVVVPVVDLYK